MPVSSTPVLSHLTIKSWFSTNRHLIVELKRLRDFAASEHRRVTAYTQPILLSYQFRTEQGAVVMNDDRLYLVENDEARVLEYYAKCDAAHRENGWTGEPGYCPALVAGYAVIEYENKIRPEIAKLFGVTDKQLGYSLNTYKKMLDLVIKGLELR